MRFEQSAGQLRGSIAGGVPAEVRPDDFGARIMREQPLEGGDIRVQARRVGRGFQRRRQVHILRHRFHVEGDGNIMPGGNIGQQEKQRIVSFGVLIGGRGGEMLGGHFAEAGRTGSENGLGALFEFLLHARPRVSGARRFDEQGIEGAATSEDVDLARIFFRAGEQLLDIKTI